uniref:Uncharacterized protein n=1 Tax=Arundo donax TaxID=35708 RepID=A0A0A8ZWJ2_ARUDO
MPPLRCPATRSHERCLRSPSLPLLPCPPIMPSASSSTCHHRWSVPPSPKPSPPSRSASLSDAVAALRCPRLQGKMRSCVFSSDLCLLLYFVNVLKMNNRKGR